jgi:hypothetical protein
LLVALKLQLNTSSTSLGDGYPSIITTDATYGDSLKFWSGQGLGTGIILDYNDTFSAVLTKTGAPADITPRFGFRATFLRGI